MPLPVGSLIASGPVIIEGGKVLLNRERKPYGITPWLFPGGEVENGDATLEDACRREAKEELGIEVELIQPLRPILRRDGERVIILIHWLAKRRGEIVPGGNTAEWGWFDVNNLPADCAQNVYDVIKDYRAAPTN
ncbi:MAG: NUDIX hydrolase [Candidatus Magasanikbacteria bacterium]|nr:NUDIX hydrolase [Candidatus Magasanikbacteria bacterium]